MAVLTALLMAAAVSAAPVQTQLSKAVTVTCRLDETITFYRDVLNQTVTEDTVRDGARVAQYVDMPPTARVRIVSLTGLDDGHGGKFGFIGVEDPGAAACQVADPGKTGMKAGDVLFSVRAVNLDEIVVRAARAGAPVIVPPGTSGSGQARNMMILDPNGRIVEVFERTIPTP